MVAGRDNPLGPSGWQSIMAVLEGCTRLTSLNGSSEYPRILAGGIESLRIEGREIAVAVGPWLARSASTLKSVEMR
jgi:hypothetical protein